MLQLFIDATVHGENWIADNFLRFYPQFLSRESWRVKDIKIADKIELNEAVHAPSSRYGEAILKND